MAGCDSPPEAEKKAAESAVAAAKQAGADKYAAQAYAAMDAAQKQADSQMAAKEYKEAKAATRRSRRLADEAAKAAVSGKAAHPGRGREGRWRAGDQVDGPPDAAQAAPRS